MVLKYGIKTGESMLKQLYSSGILFLTLMCCTVSLAAESNVTFSWLPNSETELTGYKIHYGTNDNGPYQDIVDVNNPATVDGRVHGTVEITQGVQYYAVCTAYTPDAESDYSTQVAFLIEEGNNDNIIKTFGDATGSDYPGTIVDTYINLNHENHCYSQTLMTYTWPENKVANVIILKFDLSQLPPDILIQDATLQLYLTESGGDATYDLSVHKIINNNPTLYQSTGYNFSDTGLWTANTQCNDNIPMAQADINIVEDTISVNQTVGYKSWNITSIITDWVATPLSNFGLVINPSTVASSNSHRVFASNEHTEENQRPKLVVSYTLENVLPIPSNFFIQSTD